MIRKLLTSTFVVAALCSPSIARSAPETALTIYSHADPASFDPQQFISQQQQGYNPSWVSQVPGFGVVKELRTLDLKEGLNELRFTDVAQFIDPTTVSFVDIDDAKTSVREQNFEFDLANADKILERYLDREIKVSVEKGDSTEEISGILLSAARNQLVLKTPQGIQLLNRHGPQVKLGELPGGLITKPTLVWQLFAANGGKHRVRTTYQTAGLTWRSDYNLILGENDKIADISAWVSIMNLSGRSYENTALKLIAGNVQRVEPRQKYVGAPAARSVMLDEAQGAGFEQKPFFEYHLYTLPGRTNVAQNTTQQLVLFPTARGVNVEKLMVYYGAPEGFWWSYGDSPYTDRQFGTGSNKKLDVYLRFKNEKANQLGMPLPKGKVRVYKQDSADGGLEFVGEDLIDHTPRDEKVLIKLGEAFDVVGERTQTNYTIDLNGRRITESFKIELRNHKDSPQRVLVKENLYRWTNWEITVNSDAFEKADARTVHFPVEVPAHGHKTVTYTVRYSW
jgi:hypothetical protein